MNRLVIIGNGFDLAHGLPTGYKHFIDDYWKDLDLKDNEDTFIKLYSAVKYKKRGVTNYSSFKALIEDFVRENFPTGTISFHDGIKVHISNTLPWRSILEFKNNFFREINFKCIENWVDIENEYYSSLKEIIKSDYVGETRESKIELVKRLNKEFNEVKTLLEKYLKEKVNDLYDFTDLNNDFKLVFENVTLIGRKRDDFFKEISKSGERMLKEDYNEYMKKSTGYAAANYEHLKINISTSFLSFNYTSTMNSYLKFIKLKDEQLNEIHGNILDENNPINFGFGDEMDNHYKQIEDMNDNEYLKNIKSFQYLHTSNYKRLLDLIDSEVFQVYIMGHSCGLSDRTLLNTIFEHENCCSIKIFYHKKDDGTDNYTEITQNISRHFNKKALMREKIVNKTLSQPLPQIQLPKKQNDPPS